MSELTVFIREDDVQLSRAPYLSGGNSTSIYIAPKEIDDLIAMLSTAKQKMAKNKRVAAQKLLTQAEQLDPQNPEASHV